MIADWLPSEWRWLLAGVIGGVVLVLAWWFRFELSDALAEAWSRLWGGA